MSFDPRDLAAPFPADQIHWRAQSMKADGTAALALAYLDARDVMDRLDEVCGPANWQDRFEVHGDKTICYLSIRIGDDWITKADGGGDTDVEGEKGALSGALKRAAVKWGVGRYLYDLGNTWVDCESYEKGGKKYWKRWKGDPWAKVQNAARFLPPRSSAPRLAGTEAKPAANDAADDDARVIADTLVEALSFPTTLDNLAKWKTTQWPHIKPLPKPLFDRVVAAYKKREAELMADEPANLLEAG